MCDDEAMTLTGERPSADEAWNVCVAEGNCAAARQGGEQPEANDPAQNSMTMRLNSIRPVRNGEPALAKAKPVAQAMRMASPQRAKAATIRNGRVIGVSEVGKCRRQSHEARAGARRERRGSQSPHSSAETGWELTRYADDFIIQCRSREEAESALLAVRQWVTEAGLTLHPEKTRIVNASQPGGFDFLGWHFESGCKWPREKSVKRFKETLREHTGRSNGDSMGEIIQRLNRRLKGWAQYFRGGQGNTYEALDGWLRMRLRCILRRRAGRKGRGRPDHRNYTNAYFVELGLISLKASAWVKRASPA